MKIKKKIDIEIEVNDANQVYCDDCQFYDTEYVPWCYLYECGLDSEELRTKKCIEMFGVKNDNT